MRELPSGWRSAGKLFVGEVLRVDVNAPDPAIVKLAADVLKDGKVIAAPSDTVYGLLGGAGSAQALDTLRRLKSRAGFFLHLISGVEWVDQLCSPLDSQVRSALDTVWPGPVTVILPVSDQKDGVAFRVPRNPWLKALLEAVGGPLLSTSANPRGEPTPQSVVEVVSWFPELPLIIDGGKADSRGPSTLVDARMWPGRVLRDGGGDAAPFLGRP